MRKPILLRLGVLFFIHALLSAAHGQEASVEQAERAATADEDLLQIAVNMRAADLKPSLVRFLPLDSVKIYSDSPIDAPYCKVVPCAHLANSYRGILTRQREDIEVMLDLKLNDKKTGRILPSSCLSLGRRGKKLDVYSLQNKTLKLSADPAKKNQFLLTLGNDQFIHFAFNGSTLRTDHIQGNFYERQKDGKITPTGNLTLRFDSVPSDCR